VKIRKIMSNGLRLDDISQSRLDNYLCIQVNTIQIVLSNGIVANNHRLPSVSLNFYARVRIVDNRKEVGFREGEIRRQGLPSAPAGREARSSAISGYALHFIGFIYR